MLLVCLVLLIMCICWAWRGGRQRPQVLASVAGLLLGLACGCSHSPDENAGSASIQAESDGSPKVLRPPKPLMLEAGKEYDLTLEFAIPRDALEVARIHSSCGCLSIKSFRCDDATTRTEEYIRHRVDGVFNPRRKKPGRETQRLDFLTADGSLSATCVVSSYIKGAAVFPRKVLRMAASPDIADQAKFRVTAYL